MPDGELKGLQEMFLAVARSLVDHPDEVSISLISDDSGTVFQIQSSPKDVAKLIGKGGRTASALRVILGGIARKLRRDLRLDIVTPNLPVLTEDQYASSTMAVVGAVTSLV